ncbi:hypothetical protein [Bacillus sp. PS06]|uniref:hypothetical protein n=1 Tax=Bacillus sp. PS06 TaxID=2764176 RepID=UPI00177D7296|nr:hypothetical protein [Bacillus sp. PS06]MBD8069558.1 hypothetical protein [Bacillus sp. PS06]
MKKYVIVSLFLLIITVISFTFYKYREQSLGDVLNISNVDKFHLIAENTDNIEFELTKIDEETMNKLVRFFNHYQVKLTNKHGWVSTYENERFELYLEYKDGELGRYTIERDVVVSTHVYDVVNAPLDYQWIVAIEKEINSK